MQRKKKAPPLPLFIAGAWQLRRLPRRPDRLSVGISVATVWPRQHACRPDTGWPQDPLCGACAGFEEAARIRLGAVFIRWIRARRIKVM